MTDAVSRVTPSASNSTDTEKKVHSSPQDSRGGLDVGGGMDGGAGPESAILVRGLRVGDESERARLIHEISRVIRDPLMPESTRTAGLTLIGWLARRMPGEPAHALGVPEARESERRIRAARQKLR